MDIHTCSYYCDRPECTKAQRDRLRDEVERLRTFVAAFDAWRALDGSSEVLSKFDAMLAAREAIK